MISFIIENNNDIIPPFAESLTVSLIIHALSFNDMFDLFIYNYRFIYVNSEQELQKAYPIMIYVLEQVLEVDDTFLTLNTKY